MASVSIDRRTGNLVVRAYAGVNPATGKVMTKNETLPAGASEADIEAARRRVDARAAVTKGDPRLMTVGTLLAWHLECMEQDGASPATMSAYRSYERRHVAPRIGGAPVESADAALFSRFYRELRRDRPSGGAQLSAATVEKIHAMLSGCFSHAVSDGLLAASPLAGVKVPRGRSPEVRPLLPDDMGRLVAWIGSALAEPGVSEESFERHALGAIVDTALGTGLRRGELAALRRVNLRLSLTRGETAYLQVRESVVWKRGAGWIYKEPKSAASKRSVALAGSLSEALDDWYFLVTDFQGARTGMLPAASGPLFCHADGSMWTPDEIADGFKAACREAGLPEWVHLHTLRHTHATWLLEAGENMRTVQERLGHSDVRVTLQIYGHVMPGRDAGAAAAFEAAAGAASARGAPRRRAPRCPLPGAAGACPMARNAG